MRPRVCLCVCGLQRQRSNPAWCSCVISFLQLITSLNGKVTSVILSPPLLSPPILHNPSSSLSYVLCGFVIHWAGPAETTNAFNLWSTIWLTDCGREEGRWVMPLVLALCSGCEGKCDGLCLAVERGEKCLAWQYRGCTELLTAKIGFNIPFQMY